MSIRSRIAALFAHNSEVNATVTGLEVARDGERVRLTVSGKTAKASEHIVNVYMPRATAQDVASQLLGATQGDIQHIALTAKLPGDGVDPMERLQEFCRDAMDEYEQGRYRVSAATVEAVFGYENALTPDEWAQHFPTLQRRPDFLAQASPLALQVGTRHALPNTATVQDDERRALAALCLYQQHFGFTQDDVDFLNDIARGDDGENMLSGSRDMAEDLAYRIARLLPPQNEDA